MEMVVRVSVRVVVGSREVMFIGCILVGVFIVGFVWIWLVGC